MGDVIVHRDDLEHAQAYWEPEHRVILLDRRLDQRERRSCLAHELAHLELGDVALEAGPDAARQGRRQESAADQLAASRLITLDALADALVWCLGADEVAEELHVTPWAVTARLRSLDEDEKAYIEGRIAAKGEVA
jgi:Zn-dependent peptidase ImmA (M78 family)